MFAHVLWNVYLATADGTSRTNNAIEGWHQRFIVLVAAHHPTIWKFIETIKSEQSHTDHKLNQNEAGAAVQNKRRKYMDSNSNTRLFNIIEKHGTIPVMQYLLGIAHNLVYNE